MRRKIRRKEPVFKQAVWIGLPVSILLFCLLLVASVGSFSMPFLSLGIVSGIIAVLWMVLFPLGTRMKVGQAIFVSLGLGVGTFVLGLFLTFLLVLVNQYNYLASSGLQANRQEYVNAGKQFNLVGSFTPGKMVILEKGEWSDYNFSDMQFSLPREFIPISHDEVETVVLISYDKKTVARYSNGGFGYQWSGQVRCIDFRSNTVVLQRGFTGSYPPHVITTRDGEGSKPVAETRKWVKEWITYSPGPTSVAANNAPSPPGENPNPLFPFIPQAANPEPQAANPEPQAANPEPPPVNPKPPVPAPPPVVNPKPSFPTKPPPIPFEKPRTPPPATKFPGLVAYWSFDEDSGEMGVDGAGNKLQGKLFGGQFVPGIRGQAVEFNGTSDFFDLSMPFNLNIPAYTPFTLAGWVKTYERKGTILGFRKFPGDGPVLDVKMSFKKLFVQVREDGKIFFPNEIKSPTPLLDGEWHHFALTREANGSIEFFQDGMSVGNKANKDSAGSITTNLRALGVEPHELKTKKFGDLDMRYLQGCVDEVCIFSRVLTQREIAELAGRGRE